MENNIIVKNYDTKEIKNARLRKATENINKIGTELRKNYFKVAAIIARVEADKAFEEDGFRSVHEWTEKCFGIKRSVSYSLLRIGKEETMEVLDDRGRVIDYTSKTHDNDGNGFTVTQLERMASLDAEVKEELISNGSISADMTCREIMDVVKANKKDSAPDQPEEELKPETFKVIIKGSRSKSWTLLEGLYEGELREVINKIAAQYGQITAENKEDK